MALVYRAHFALAARPIFTSKGVNTSALYGFTQTLLDILNNQQPSHIAVAFDTDAPTHRHTEFAEYKATRQAMPEDLSLALPSVRRMLEAFRIPVLTCDGYEADDIIGTLVRRAQKEGFKSYMVTSDKDLGQLVDENTFLYKPSRMGDAVAVMGVEEIRARWAIQQPEQVIDVLALMGDSSDNIPGVPGIGEKTAMKLVGQYGTVENLLAHTGELNGRIKANLEANRDLALLSKRLATITCDVPCPLDLDSLKVQSRDDEKVKALFLEFEFNSIGRRLFGDEFKAGRGFPGPGAASNEKTTVTAVAAEAGPASAEQELVLVSETEPVVASQPTATSNLKTVADVPHEYRIVATRPERAALLKQLSASEAFSLAALGTSRDPKQARLLGIGFALEPHQAFYVPIATGADASETNADSVALLEEFRPVLESERTRKIGHNLKFALGALKWYGVTVRGEWFDSLIAHSLVEPEMRHNLQYLCEAYLGYSPLSLAAVIGDPEATEAALASAPQSKLADLAAESADLAWQLRSVLEPLLKDKGQERVFYQIESPLVSVLAEMEFQGIRVDAAALNDFATQLGKEIDELERTICRLAGTTFNLNSPRQLGQILFDVMKICEPPKKTRTGQYATDEQTLAALAPDHEIVQRLLEHRAATKLKSTYADALPLTIWPATGRIHTTFNQVMTTTGRLNSQEPNLQNIPIRSDRGQEIRKAFVPRSNEYRLLSADYSQIELRIIAALSREAGLLEAFRTGADVHTTTAARVFGVLPGLVTPEMRRKAKMVNYGIAYGISAFGLAQRLRIPRKEAAQIITEYFNQFPGIRRYMDDTIAFARKQGYVQTVTGRRRYIRDINSSNNTVRSGAERNAINAPIQGSAADMIKLAMIQIHRALEQRQLKTRMVLQVHDELVFDLYQPEEAEVRALVEDKMKTAIPLEVPMVVELGVGRNWLEAH